MTRAITLAQNPMTVWLTGLSGSGKSTVAYDFEYELILRGFKAFVLDEVARLMNDAGLVVISAFISPPTRVTGKRLDELLEIRTLSRFT